MHFFDKDMVATGKSEKKGSSIHHVNISERYNVVSHPNGGYLMAVMASRLMDISDKGRTPIITTNFLAPSSVGPADVRITEISRSKSFSRFEGRLIQGNNEVVRSMGTFMADDLHCSLDRYEEQSPVVMPPDECEAMPGMPDFSLFDTMDIRLEPQSAGWMKGQNGDKSEVKGWIRFREERPFDIFGIILAADSFFPPILVTQGMSSWVPTIEMSVNIRNLPEGYWLKGIFRTKHITCGLLEEDGELWDEAGNLVAISRQIAQFRG